MKSIMLSLFVLITMPLFGQVQNAPEKVLRVLNWIGYFDLEVIKDFERENFIHLEVTEYYSVEDCLTKLRSGAVYDVMILPQDVIPEEVNNLIPLDQAKIPNRKLIKKKMMAKDAYDPGHRYSVPYGIMAPVLVAKNSVWPKGSTSIKVLEESRFDGKVLVMDDPRLPLGLGLIALGYDYNSQDQAQLKKAAAWLKKKGNFSLQSGVSSQELENGNGLVFFGYPGFLSDLASSSEYRFFYPKERGPLYIDSLVIPKNSGEIQSAYRLINYFLDPRVHRQNMNLLKLHTFVEGADPENYPLPGTFDEVLDQVLEGPISSKTRALYQSLIDEVKSGQ